jgi:ubiquinone biosynthesis protein UbiJ
MFNDFYEQFKVILAGLQFVGMACLSVYTWQTGRDKAQDTRLGSLEKAFADKVAEHEVRLTKLEEHQKHTPGSAEVALLTERINQFGSQVDRLNHGLDRINLFLLQNK